MKKRLSIFISTVVVALSIAVPVHAQEQKPIAEILKVEPLPVVKEEPTVIINADVLKEKESVIEQKQDTVEQKALKIKETETEAREVEAKAQVLAADIEAKRTEVEALRAKVAEKKRQDAERYRLEQAELQPVIARGVGAGEPSNDNPNGCNLETQWVRADNKQCKNKNTTVVAPFVAAAPVRVASTNSSGNTYEAGQCTWHVKNLRPDLPNSLGNADTWYQRATAMGLPTGAEPRVGAAAPRKTGMHVVYVTAVHGDGTITVSEMNYAYVPYQQREVVKNASDYFYIY